MKRMKKILSLGLMLALVSATGINADNTQVKSNFADINGHWGATKIQEALNNGIIDDGMAFRPDAAITRYEFAEMINKAIKQETVSDRVFTDLEKGSKKETEMLKAVANGYIVGYSDNTIKPDNNLLRQEAAAMIATALKLEDNQEAGKKYADFTQVADYAKGKVGAVSIAQIMGGNLEGRFMPTGNLTRTEGMTIALNMSSNTTKDVVIDKDGTVLKDQTIEGNLVISEALGNGSATLNNVTVLGKTVINGGGKNSIHVINSNLNEMVVNDAKNEVRISFEGTTKVEQVTMNSGATLESPKTFTGAIANVEISNTAATAPTSEIKINVPVATVKIAGDATIKTSINSAVGNVEIKEVTNVQGQVQIIKTPPVLNITKDAVVGKIVADTKITIQGEGQIKDLQVNVDGVTTEIKADKTETAPSVTPPVVTPPTPPVVTPPSGGGGGGGGGTVITYDTTVTKGEIHLEDGTIVEGAVSNGVMTFDLAKKSGTITGITLASASDNVYTVTKVTSPLKGTKTGTWTCHTKDKQDMKMFIDYAKNVAGFGGATNTTKMPISVIETVGGTGAYSVEGTINGKTLVINITL